VALTPREKDRVRMARPKTTNPRHYQRRVMGIQRRKSGVSSTKSIGSILLGATFISIVPTTPTSNEGEKEAGINNAVAGYRAAG
jgi:hypothetical protein